MKGCKSGGCDDWQWMECCDPVCEAMRLDDDICTAGVALAALMAKRDEAAVTEEDR